MVVGCADPPAAASAESDEALLLASLIFFVPEGMVSGTMATECIAESRKEGLPGSLLCIIVLD